MVLCSVLAAQCLSSPPSAPVCLPNSTEKPEGGQSAPVPEDKELFQSPVREMSPCQLLLLFSLLLGRAVTRSGAAPAENSDENKPYEFGFVIEGEQHRYEKKDERGIIMGEYGFITADGVYHVTVYATDENGNFRILKTKNIRIGLKTSGDVSLSSNLPGTTTKKPEVRPSFDVKKLTGSQGCSGCLIPTTTQRPQGAYAAVGGNGLVDGGGTPGGTGGYRGNAGELSGGTQNSLGAGFRGGSPVLGGGTSGFGSGRTTPIGVNIVSGRKEGAVGRNAEIGGSTRGGAEAGNGLGGVGLGNTGRTGVTGGGIGGPGNGGTKIPTGFENYGRTEGGVFGKDGLGGSITNPNSGGIGGLRVGENGLVGGERQGTVNTGGINTPGETGADFKGPGLSGPLYRFNYTLTHHGHEEEGDVDGRKKGKYYVEGPDSYKRMVEYLANEFGYQPFISQINANHDPTLENQLIHSEFLWFFDKLRNITK